MGRVGVVAALLTTLAGQAMAAPSDPAQATEYFRRGRQLFNAAQFGRALEKFKLGYRAYPSPEFWINIGQCQRRLGLLDDAAKSFKSFLRAQGSDPALRAEVEEVLREVQGEIRRRARDDHTAPPLTVASSEDKPMDQRKAEPLSPTVAASQAEPQEKKPRLMSPSIAFAPASSDVELLPLSSKGESGATPHPRRRTWLIWTVSAVAATGLTVGLGVGLTEASGPRPGSFGLIDGSRR